MKRLTLITAVLVLFAMTASAQVPKPFTVYADAGLTMPNGDFNTLYKAGLHFGAGVGFNVGPNFQIVPNIEYHSFSMDFLGFSGGKMTVLMFGANGRMALGAGPMPVKPFFLGGLGLARGSTEAIQFLATEITTDATSTNFYWNVGAGVELMGLFVQARYVSISSGGGSLNYIPVTLGLKF